MAKVSVTLEANGLDDGGVGTGQVVPRGQRRDDVSAGRIVRFRAEDCCGAPPGAPSRVAFAPGGWQARKISICEEHLDEVDLVKFQVLIYVSRLQWNDW